MSYLFLVKRLCDVSKLKLSKRQLRYRNRKFRVKEKYEYKPTKNYKTIRP